MRTLDGLLLAPAVFLLAGGVIWAEDAAPGNLVWTAVCVGSVVSLMAHWRMSRRNR